MKINEIENETLFKLGKERARLGHLKYGDRDQFRDGALDMMEEVLDVINILDRRNKWVNEANVGSLETLETSVEIFRTCEVLIEKIKDYDKAVRVAGYEVDDKNGGERWGIEILKGGQMKLF